MESDSDTLKMEPGVTVPARSKPAALKVRNSVKSGADAGANQALLERLFAQCPILKGGECGAAANQLLLERILTMAHRDRSDGNLRQAIELYWTLVEDHPGTPEADAARAVLLGLADDYERNGTRHMARSIYERLLAD